MTNVADSWKNSNVFKKQLELNTEELNGKYPEHWNAFIQLLKINQPKNMLDVGCGCGAYYQLCKREFPNMGYFGVDYAESAIKLAKDIWNKSCFSVKNYASLLNEDVINYDLVHMGALLDVLPNGDEALEHILSISPKAILIARMKFTDNESYYDTYEAYNEIITCAYYHNKSNFLKLCEKYNYIVSNIDNNFYLKKR